MRYDLNDLKNTEACKFIVYWKEFNLVDILRKFVVKFQKSASDFIKSESINMKIPIFDFSIIKNDSNINQILEIFERICLFMTFIDTKSDNIETSIEKVDVHQIMIKILNIERYLRLSYMIDEIELINKSFRRKIDDNNIYQKLLNEQKLLRDKIVGYIKKIVDDEECERLNGRFDRRYSDYYQI